MKLLNDIVREMLETHKGGEKFFDNLDESLRNKAIIQELCDIVPWRIDTELIVSGTFGQFFHNYSPLFHPIIVRGGLRKDPTLNLEYMRDRISGIDCVFIDDSFFLGRTRDAIKKEVERLGGRLIQTYVIYDGSKIKDNSVSSLYRYYDNH